MHDMSERIDDVLAKVERQISTDQPRQADEQSEAGDETQKYPKDCSEVASLGNTESGVYLIQPSAVTYSLSEKSPRSPMQPFYVYCHMDGEEGWTVIQRREDGSENFNRTWADYKQGFGNPWREYWIGNDRLHVLTTHARYKLQVYLVDWEGRSGYAVYKRFVVEGEEDEYRLRVGSYFGTVGDSLVSHRNYEFSTWDREQGYNCTPKYRAGWWHRHCSYSYFTNLNGRYKEGQSFSPTYDGVEWYQWKKKQGYSLRFVEMRVIPIG
ncbi:fibrinogen-like protein 1 [Branchiostoma lanceolatum]|uniref:fibrinogen-like protein 1 n=1 Tax=Branchiostoma lanceolatum TaxID=7740 RepID=UPI003456EE46